MKKRNILFGLICFVMIFTLTGCTNKTVLTTEDFKTKLEEQGLTVVDTTSQHDSSTHIKESTIATSKDGYQISFYIFYEIDNAQDKFNTIKTDFQNEKGGQAIQTVNNMKNYSTYSLQSNGYYMYVCRVDNTLLSIKADEKYKDTIKDIVKKLGY